MNSLNNGMHRKDIWFFQKNHFTGSNPIETGKHKVNFLAFDLSYANDACMFCPKECVNNNI